MTKRRIGISACVITKNEEKNIARCLNNIRDLVDEIIVVDSFSTDKTVEIARRYTDKVYQRQLASFSEQRNYASSLASNRWVLHIDADEVWDDDLRREIERLFVSGEYKKYAAFCFAKKTFDEKGEFVFELYSYPGFHYRLYDRDRCFWKRKVHETLEIDGRKKFIPFHFLHYPDFSKIERKETQYGGFQTAQYEEAEQRSDRKSGLQLSQALANAWFHFKAMYIDLKFYQKGWRYWLFGLRWMIYMTRRYLREKL